jgi:Sigma 54 modulation protein / S30EA ribosomal protein
MSLDIQGLQDPRLTERVVTEIEAVLDRYGYRPIGVRVMFGDENGPKGGVDTKCTMVVPVPPRAVVRAEHLAPTPHEAFEGSLAALGRQLGERRSRTRALSRRPKKYYVAKQSLRTVESRELEEGGGTPRRRAG